MEQNKRWASASKWARQININKRKFNSYLVKLGYLSTIGNKNQYVITEMGREHTKCKKRLFGKVVLWDFDTFADVVTLRAKESTVIYHCPRCKAKGFYAHIEDTHKCEKCGLERNDWKISVSYGI